MEFSLPMLLVLLIATIDILLGGVIFLQDPKHRINRAYGLFALTVSMWGFAVAAYLGTASGNTSADWLARFVYFAGGTIPASFLYFTNVLLAKDDAVSSKTTLSVFLPTLLFIPLYFWTDLVIAGGVNLDGTQGFAYGEWRYLFDIHLWGFFFLAFIALVKARIGEKESQRKLHLLFILLGTYSVLAVAGITNVINPTLGIFSLIWIGPSATIIWVGIVAYAVMKHRLFNIKIVTVEVLVFLLWLLLLGRMFLSDTPRDFAVNGITFASTVLLGAFLLRGIIKEVSTRERMETLATDLAKANERLRELDRQKTEFVSIASHQLRSPLTAIKGYASLLLEGSFGKLPMKAKDAVERIFDSSRFMALSIEDFLNVSRIELGTIKYDMKEMDLFMLAKEIVREMLPGAKEKGLTLTISGTTTEPCRVLGDHGKLRQVVLNLVDNAMKYTPKGHIAVSVIPDTGTATARMVIADTGVGIPKEVIPKLFQKFSRADNANEVNVMGTGLGLYVAKEFVEAHNGKIWAESEGQGKGARFIVEFPMRHS